MIISTTDLAFRGTSEPDGLMVFDGLCHLCSSLVKMALMMDRAGVVRFTSMQSPYGRSLCAQNGIDPDGPTTFLFFEKGEALRASSAMLAIFARMPRPWRWLGLFGVLPVAWRDGAYHWIARNRYAFFGRRRDCLMPTAALRTRFVDLPPG